MTSACVDQTSKMAMTQTSLAKQNSDTEEYDSSQNEMENEKAVKKQRKKQKKRPRESRSMSDSQSSDDSVGSGSNKLNARVRKLRNRKDVNYVELEKGPEVEEEDQEDCKETVIMFTKTMTNIHNQNVGEVESYTCGLARTMLGLQKTGELCNVLLMGKDCSVRAHSVVLACACPKFKSEILGFAKESSSSACCIYLRHLVQEELDSVVQYMYTGEVTLTPQTARRLRHTFTDLQLPDAAEKCKEFISKTNIKERVPSRPSRTTDRDLQSDQTEMLGSLKGEHRVGSDRYNAGRTLTAVDLVTSEADEHTDDFSIEIIPETVTDSSDSDNLVQNNLPDGPTKNTGDYVDVAKEQNNLPDGPTKNTIESVGVAKEQNNLPDGPTKNTGDYVDVAKEQNNLPDGPTKNTGDYVDVAKEQNNLPDGPTKNTGDYVDVAKEQNNIPDGPTKNTGDYVDVAKKQNNIPDETTKNTGDYVDVAKKQNNIPDETTKNTGDSVDVAKKQNNFPDETTKNTGDSVDVAKECVVVDSQSEADPHMNNISTTDMIEPDRKVSDEMPAILIVPIDQKNLMGFPQVDINALDTQHLVSSFTSSQSPIVHTKRKHVRKQSFPTQIVDEVAFDISDSIESPPVKRKRGRPKKDSNSTPGPNLSAAVVPRKQRHRKRSRRKRQGRPKKNTLPLPPILPHTKDSHSDTMKQDPNSAIKKPKGKNVKMKKNTSHDNNIENDGKIEYTGSKSGNIENFSLGRKRGAQKRCRKCHLFFASSKECTAHRKVCYVRQTPNPDSLVCAKCGAEFPNHEKKKLHVKKCKVTRVHLICHGCNYQGESPADIVKHRAQHKKEWTKSYIPIRNARKRSQNTCEFCGKGFVFDWALISHQASKHGIPLACNGKYPVFKCDKCRYETIQTYLLRKHIAVTHGNKRNIMCEICGNTFATNCSLSSHIRNVHEKRVTLYQCRHCEKSYRSKMSLQKHMDVKHSTGTASLFQCDQCEFSTNYDDTLKNHQFSKHNIPLPDHYQRYDCEFCGYFTRHRNQYHNHMRRHTGEKPYLCPECGKSFPAKSDLTSHRKWHVEKKFKCSFENCKYSTTCKTSLTSHIRTMHTHKDEKPHACHICLYRSNIRGNLRLHLKNVHKQLVEKRKSMVVPEARAKAGLQTNQSTSSVPEVEKCQTTDPDSQSHLEPQDLMAEFYDKPSSEPSLETMEATQGLLKMVPITSDILDGATPGFSTQSVPVMGKTLTVMTRNSFGTEVVRSEHGEEVRSVLMPSLEQVSVIHDSQIDAGFQTMVAPSTNTMGILPTTQSEAQILMSGVELSSSGAIEISPPTQKDKAVLTSDTVLPSTGILTSDTVLPSTGILTSDTVLPSTGILTSGTVLPSTCIESTQDEVKVATMSHTTQPPNMSYPATYLSDGQQQDMSQTLQFGHVFTQNLM